VSRVADRRFVFARGLTAFAVLFSAAMVALGELAGLGSARFGDFASLLPWLIPLWFGPEMVDRIADARAARRDADS